jgi:DNA-binding Lrp family transcriptional regulator
MSYELEDLTNLCEINSDSVSFDWLADFIQELYKLKEVIINGKSYPVNLIDINTGVVSEDNHLLNRAFFIRFNGKDNEDTKIIIDQEKIKQLIKKRTLLQEKLKRTNESTLIKQYIELTKEMENYNYNKELSADQKTTLRQRYELESKINKEYVELTKLIEKNKEMHYMVDYLTTYNKPLLVMINFVVPEKERNLSFKNTSISTYPKLSILRDTQWTHFLNDKLNKGLQGEYYIKV